MVPVTVRSLEFRVSVSVVQDGASTARWFEEVAGEKR
jgi:hypothetical protein